MKAITSEFRRSVKGLMMVTELPTNRITSAIKSSVVAFGDGLMYSFKSIHFFAFFEKMN